MHSCVPYLGISLSDMLFTEDGNEDQVVVETPSGPHQHVNFVKFRRSVLCLFPVSDPSAWGRCWKTYGHIKEHDYRSPKQTHPCKHCWTLTKASSFSRPSRALMMFVLALCCVPSVCGVRVTMLCACGYVGCICDHVVSHL